MTTPNLDLPELTANQAQPHVTINSALRRLDALGQLSVIDRALNTPPGSPADGDCYIVGDTPTGAWSGYAENSIAAYIGTAWVEISPEEGWLAWVRDEDLIYAFTGTAWAQAGGGSGVPDGGSTGQVLTKASATNQDVIWATPVSGGGLSPFTGYYRKADFDDLAGWSSELSGTGASANLEPDLITFARNGIVTLRTGETAAGRAGVALAPDASVTAPMVSFGVEDAVLSFMVSGDPDGSFATDYVFRFGVGNGLLAGGPTLGFHIYTDSGNWWVDRFGSTVDTGQAVQSEAWESFRIEVDNAAEEIRTYINGVLRDTFDNSGLTTVQGTLYVQIEKTSGTTERYAHCDFVELTQVFSRAP